MEYLSTRAPNSSSSWSLREQVIYGLDLWKGHVLRRLTSIRHLQQNSDHCTQDGDVSIVPFVCGVRSYINEGAWAEAWSSLRLKESALKKLIPKVQAWNVEEAK